jgi:hypothetical protein
MVDPDTIRAFGDKSLADVLEEIYDKSRDTSRTVNGLIDQLSEFMETKDQALVLVPLIKDYLDIDLKNDEKLVKIANVVQRVATASMSEDGGASGELGDAAKSELRQIAKDLNDQKERELKSEADAAIEEAKKVQSKDLDNV